MSVREGEGREVEEAGNAVHKHTGRHRDKPKGGKKSIRYKGSQTPMPTNQS